MGPKTKLLIGISLGVAVLAGLVFYFFFYNARLTIVPTPSNADIFINDQAITGGAPVKLAPGEYEITVRAQGYLSTKQRVALRVSDLKTLPISLRQIPTARALVGSVQFPVLSKDGSRVFYLGRDGKQFFAAQTVLGADSKARVQPISEERFSNLTNVAWSSDQSLAILQTSDGKTKLFDFTRYNFVDQEEKELSSNFRSVTWHPAERVIVAFESTPEGERSLVRVDIESGKQERLVDLRPHQLVSPALSWSPDGRKVALVENAIFLYDLATRSVQKLSGTDGVKAAKWSPSSQELLAELDDGLAVVALGEGRGGRLGLRTTLDKTTWTDSGSDIFVATSTARGRDTLQLVDAATATRKFYTYQSDSTITVTAPILAEDGKQVWFVSQGTLYGLLLEFEGSAE